MNRVDIGLEPGVDPDTVASTLEDRLRLEPYVLSTPQDIAATLRGSTSEFQATTSLIAAIALFAGAFLVFNTLSMTVVEQVRERWAPPGGRRDSPTGHRVHAHPGGRPRRARVPRRGWPGGAARGRHGGVCADHRVGHPRAPAHPARCPADRVPGRPRRHDRRRAGTRPPGRPDPASRGPEGTARPANRSSRPAPLAGRRLRGRVDRGPARRSSWSRGHPARDRLRDPAGGHVADPVHAAGRRAGGRYAVRAAPAPGGTPCPWLGRARSEPHGPDPRGTHDRARR